MIRLVLLVLVILLVTPMAAHAQKDRMSLGESLGATVKRGFGASTRTVTSTTRVPQDQLAIREQLSPAQTKGAK